MTDDTPAAASGPRSSGCPHRCGYPNLIPACVRLHLIQHHNYDYFEAQEAYPDEVASGV